MKVPIDWLQEFIKVDKSTHELQEMLTMRGLEVEEVTNEAGIDIINIELTPNRGDCASITGIARELAAYQKKNYTLQPADYSETGTPITDSYSLKVEVPEKCPLYYLKLIRGVKISESPQWLKDRLTASGVRPINNIVDITNYVMLETGQPLHAFDAASIKGKTIIVRNGNGKEEILTLDGQTVKLSGKDIVIADEKDPVAIGGVIGGENFSVTQDTTDILLESAFFIPESISLTERRLEVKTESSYRFARHIDIEGVKKALDRAVHLLEKVCSGKPAPGELHLRSVEEALKTVELDPSRISKVLGIEINIEKIKEILESLEFKVDAADNILKVVVPSFRNDVYRPIDIIEEIARVHGYENIEASLPESNIITDLLREPDIYVKADDVLQAAGCWESVTHTLMDGSAYNKLAKANPNAEAAVEIDNPINVNMNILRPSLFFGLLEICRYNINQKQSPIKFYERGPVFFKKDKAFSESQQISFVAMSDDFYDSKKIITAILDSLNQEYQLAYDKESLYFDKTKYGYVNIDRNIIAEFGCLTNDLLKIFKLSNSNFIAGCINLDMLDKDRIINRTFTKWSPFPSVFRDLSLVVPEHLTHSEIYDKIFDNGGNKLKEIVLFDIYKDDKLGSDKKSIAYKLEFNSSEATLTSEEVDESINNILAALENDLKITLRPE
jgi:phenylalanyl-tRNA synthetase beta chain